MRTKDFLLVQSELGADLVDGFGVRGNALANRIWSALEVVKGSLLSDEGWGSRLLEVRKSTVYEGNRAAKFAEEALTPLRLDGSIRTASVTATVDEKKGGIVLTAWCEGGMAGSGIRVKKFLAIG